MRTVSPSSLERPPAIPRRSHDPHHRAHPPPVRGLAVAGVLIGAGGSAALADGTCALSDGYTSASDPAANIYGSGDGEGGYGMTWST